MPEDVRGLIEAHAAECAACREEIHLVGGDAVVVEQLPPSDRVFARVLERIEESGADVGHTPVPSLDAARAERRGTVRTRRSLPLPQAIAAAIALVCISWVGGWVSAGVAPATAYAVAAEPAATPDDGVLLDVVFRGEVTFGRIQEALRRIDATVIAGPSRAGVVRLRLPPGTPPEAIATQLRGGDDPIAIFAEPVQEL